MANRYGYQYQGGYKPKMVNIEGFVSIGTGGLLNTPDQSGLGVPSAFSVTTGLPRGLLPGCATAGVPTGWAGGFSGAIGLYGAGVDGIARIATGLYSVHLSDDYVRLDSVQITPVLGAAPITGGGATGVTSVDWNVAYHTVGFGNSVSTGNMGSSGMVGAQLKNQILIQFSGTPGVNGASGTITCTPVDLPLSSGFFIALRLRDSLAGVQ